MGVDIQRLTLRSRAAEFVIWASESIGDFVIDVATSNATVPAPAPTPAADLMLPVVVVVTSTVGAVTLAASIAGDDLRVAVVRAGRYAGGNGSGPFAVGGDGANAGVIQAVYAHRAEVAETLAAALAKVRVDIAGIIVRRDRAAESQRPGAGAADDDRGDVIDEVVVEVAAFVRRVR